MKTKTAQTRPEATDRAVERGKKGALGGNPEQLNEASQVIARFEPYLNHFFWAVKTLIIKELDRYDVRTRKIQTFGKTAPHILSQARAAYDRASR